MGRKGCTVVVFVLALLGGWLAGPLQAVPVSSEAESIFQKARNEYSALLKSSKLQKSRSSWLKCIHLFDLVYESFPASDQAPESLFMVGSLYENLSGYSGSRSDLDCAISAYQRLTALYPSSRLADNAQYRIGQIHLRNKDYEQAYVNFCKVGDRFPRGDIVMEAIKRLDEMKRLHPLGERPAEVTGIRHWSNPEYTRIVIDLSGETEFRPHMIQEDRALGKPPRLCIDIHPARIDVALSQPIPIQDGLLTMARAGQYSRDIVRIVLDMESLSGYSSFPLEDPSRIIVDVHGERKGVLPNGVDSRIQKEASLSKQAGLGIGRIVIDSGHGGKDPGATGPDGLMEKDVVLKIARKLKNKLEQNGFEAILTRKGDRFIPLDERTVIANTKKADFFVSIHTNASHCGKTRGIETYVLNFATNRESMELAARENAVSTKRLSDLQYILYDLMRTTKINGSRRLAECVQSYVCKRLTGGYSDVYDLGVKEAPFYVLFGANMPSILVEVSFISNRSEEQRLSDDHYLEELAEAIKEGIEQYMKETAQNPTV